MRQQLAPAGSGGFAELCPGHGSSPSLEQSKITPKAHLSPQKTRLLQTHHGHREELPVPLHGRCGRYGVSEDFAACVGKGNLYQQHEGKGERREMTTERQFEK